MRVTCTPPSDITLCDSLEQLEQQVDSGLLAIGRYVFREALPRNNVILKPQKAPAELNVLNGLKRRPLPDITFFYARNMIVMGKHALIQQYPDKNSVYLHQFHDISDLMNPERWRSGFVRRMNLELSNLKVVEVAQLELIEPLQITRTITDPVFIIDKPRDASYSHFVWDCLPQLWYVEQINNPKLKILIPENLSGYKLEFLKNLGYGEDRLIRRQVNEHILCERIYMGTPLSMNNVFIQPDALSVLRRLRLPADAPAAMRTPKRKIFLDRNDERKGFRRLLNEADIWAVCERYGFERHTPGRLSIAEKQQLFSESDFIIGQYGGGLQNHFMCQPNTKMIVLQSELFQRYIFDCTCDDIGIQLMTVVGRAYRSCIDANNSNFMIDEDLFEQTLCELLNHQV